MDINDEKKQNRKRKFRSKCRAKKVKGFKGIPAHMKNAEKGVNSSLVETDVNEPPVDFNVAANSVQDSDENLVNDVEQPGPSGVCNSTSANKTGAHIKYRDLVNRSREKLHKCVQPKVCW